MSGSALLTEARALVARADALPADDPTTRIELARRAIDLCQRVEAASGERVRPVELVRANAERLAELDVQARDRLARLAADDPRDLAVLHDTVLLHKHARRFGEALQVAEQALASAPDRRPFLWHMALCATALGRGAVAAGAWTELGIAATVTPGGRPFVEGLVPAQLRVPTRGGSSLLASALAPAHVAAIELVWVTPLSPCHGVVASPTFREGVVDCGDVVLWDVAPAGVVSVEGVPTPRFVLLDVLARGDEIRVPFATNAARDRIAALEARLGEDARVFTFGEAPEAPCMHTGLPAVPSSGVTYGKIIVGMSVDLARFASSLESASRDLELTIAAPGLYERLGDSPRAGKAHQLWGALTRRASRGAAARA